MPGKRSKQDKTVIADTIEVSLKNNFNGLLNGLVFNRRMDNQIVLAKYEDGRIATYYSVDITERF